MVWVLMALSVGLAAPVGHGIATGTLQLKGGLDRARYPKTFWFCVVCLAAVSLYLGWLAWYDFAAIRRAGG